MHNDRLELFRESRIQIIMNTLEAYGFKVKKSDDADSNLSECIEQIVEFLQVIAPDTRSYFERHFGDESPVEHEFPLDSDRPGNPPKGTKVSAGRKVEGTGYWHLDPDKKFDLKHRKFEVYGVDSADLLITRVVHCLWRQKAWRTRMPLLKTNPLGSFEENKEFYAQEIYHALIEHLDRYAGGGEFAEVSALEAQHITLLKRRLEAETNLKKMGFTTGNPKGRIKHLQSTLYLSNPQLIEILKEIHSDLRIHNANVGKNDSNTGYVDYELERSVEKLILEVERSYEESSAKTRKARGSSKLVRARDADERLEVLTAICSHMLDSDESLTSVFLNAKQKKRRDQVIKACFQFSGEIPSPIGQVIHDSKNGLQFKWQTVGRNVNKYIKHPEENRWVTAYVSPSLNTLFTSNSYPRSFWKWLEKIDELRGLRNPKAGRAGTPRKKIKRPLGSLDPLLEQYAELYYSTHSLDD